MGVRPCPVVPHQPRAAAGQLHFRNSSDSFVSGSSPRRNALDEPAQTVSLADPTVEVAGVTLPEVVAESLIKAIVRPIPLEGLPLDLRVSSIDTRDDGLHVRGAVRGHVRAHGLEVLPEVRDGLDTSGGTRFIKRGGDPRSPVL